MLSDTLFVVCRELLAGRVLQACEVSAGNGKVIDWRDVRSGELLLDEADAFDTARLFVHLVGDWKAFEAALGPDDDSGNDAAYGVHWSDPENRREPEGWILRDGRTRWTGTRKEAEEKARVYQNAAWEGSKTRYQPRACEAPASDEGR